MATIRIDHRHGLEIDQAREKLRQLAAQLEQKYHLSFTFDGDRVQLKGTGVKGQLRLSPGRIEGEVDVPFFLKGKVERALGDRLTREFPG